LKYLKFEVLLPLKYNDKTNIERDKFTQTIDDIVTRFRGITIDDTPVVGAWIDPDTDRLIEDEIVVYWAICKHTKANVDFLNKLKNILKDRFLQKEILMYYMSIERV
jgi:hypothetical protein